MKNFAIALAAGIALLGVAIATIKLNLLSRPVSKRVFQGVTPILGPRKLNVGDSVKPTFDSNIEHNVFQQPVRVPGGA